MNVLISLEWRQLERAKKKTAPILRKEETDAVVYIISQNRTPLCSSGNYIATNIAVLKYGVKKRLPGDR